MKNTIDYIEQYGDEYLVCDGTYPFVTRALLADEAKLFKLSKAELELVCEEFYDFFEVKINPHSKIDELSGGQKIVLMFLLAMRSKADKILFVNLLDSLDQINKEKVLAIINKQSNRLILVQDANLKN